MRIIPAIDIIAGKCVRLTRGVFDTQKTYHEHPVEVARIFEDWGFQYLHLVDLDGARSNHIVNHKILEQIAKLTSLIIDFGGGIKGDEDVKIAFESGAKQITGGSIAARNPETFLWWLNQYGSDKVILGADAIDRKIATHGWLEHSGQDVVHYIAEYEKMGVRSVVCTDIAKDGMLQGVSENMYKEILQQTSVKLIASGGVSSLDDILLLKNLGCDGAIIGKAIYEGTIALPQLRELC